MASVPNRVYPENEYREIRTDVFNAKIYSALCKPHVFTGFKAQGTIAQYQAVVFSTDSATAGYVSGATSWGQAGIIGVAAAAYTDGQTVDVISRGIVPAISSGAAIINTGSPVIYAASGSRSAYTYDTVANFVNAPGLTSGSSIIGYVITAGAAVSASLCTIWVMPQCVGTS